MANKNHNLDLRTLVMGMRSDISELKDEFPSLRQDITELKTSFKYAAKLEGKVEQNSDKLNKHDRWLFGAYLVAAVFSVLIPIVFNAIDLTTKL